MSCATGPAPAPKALPVDRKTSLSSSLKPSVSPPTRSTTADPKAAIQQPHHKITSSKGQNPQPPSNITRLDQRTAVRLLTAPKASSGISSHGTTRSPRFKHQEEWRRVSTAARGETPQQVLEQIARDYKGVPSAGTDLRRDVEKDNEEIFLGLRAGYLIDVRGAAGKRIDPARVAELITLRLTPPGIEISEPSVPRLDDAQVPAFAIGIAQALFARGFAPQEVHTALRAVADCIKLMAYPVKDKEPDERFLSWRQERYQDCDDAFRDVLLPGNLRSSAHLRRLEADLQASQKEVTALKRAIADREQTLESLKQVNTEVQAGLFQREQEFQQTLQQLRLRGEAAGAEVQQAESMNKELQRQILQWGKERDQFRTLNETLQTTVKELEGQLQTLGEKLQTQQQSHAQQLKGLQGEATENRARIRALEERETHLQTQLEASEAVKTAAEQAQQTAQHEHAKALQNQQQKFMEALGKKETEIERLTAEVSRLTAELEKSKDRLAPLESQLTRQRSLIDTQKGTIRDLTSGRQRLEQELAQLQGIRGSLSRSEQAHGETQEKLTESEKQVARWRQQAQETQASLDKLTQENNRKDEQIAAGKDELSSRATTISNLRGELAAAKGDAAQGKALLEAARVQNGDLEDQVRGRDAHISRQSRTIENLRSRQTSLETELSRLRGVESLLQQSQARARLLEQQADTAGKDKQQLAQQISALQLQVAAQAREISSLEGQLKAAEASAQGNAQRFAATEKQLSTLRDKLEVQAASKDARINEISKALEESQTLQAAQSNEIARLSEFEASLPASEKLAQQLQQQLTATTTQNQRLAEQFSTLAQEVEQLRHVAVASGAEVAALNGHRTRDASLISSLQAGIEQQQSRLAAQDSSIQTLSENNARLLLENSALREQVEALTRAAASPGLPTVSPTKDDDVQVPAVPSPEDLEAQSIEELEAEYQELSSLLEAHGEDTEALLRKHATHSRLGHQRASGQPLSDSKGWLSESAESGSISLDLYASDSEKRREAFESAIRILRAQREALESTMTHLADELYDISDPIFDSAGEPLAVPPDPPEAEPAAAPEQPRRYVSLDPQEPEGPTQS